MLAPKRQATFGVNQVELLLSMPLGLYQFPQNEGL